MKILVFSDSHGRTLGMVRAVRQQQPDAVFHLGDCERDTQRLEKEFPDLPLYRVCGNCDRAQGIPRRCGRSSRRCSARTPGSVWPGK